MIFLGCCLPYYNDWFCGCSNSHCKESSWSLHTTRQHIGSNFNKFHKFCEQKSSNMHQIYIFCYSLKEFFFCHRSRCRHCVSLFSVGWKKMNVCPFTEMLIVHVIFYTHTLYIYYIKDICSFGLKANSLVVRRQYFRLFEWNERTIEALSAIFPPHIISSSDVWTLHLAFGFRERALSLSLLFHSLEVPLFSNPNKKKNKERTTKRRRMRVMKA